MLRITAIFFCLLVFGGSSHAQKNWSLEECVDYALANNLTVLQSQLNIERSEIRRDQTRYNLLPNLNGQASYGFNFGQRIDPFTNEFAQGRVTSGNVFLSSSVDLFNAFSKMNQLRQTEEALQASRYDYETVKNDIALQLCLFYLQVLLNKEAVAIAQEQVNISIKQLDRVSKLVDAGQEPQGALYDAESQLAQEELNLTNANNGVVLALLNLTQLMQLEPEEAAQFDVVTPDLTDEGVELLNNSSQDIYIRALDLMPQIQSAKHQLLASEYALSAARGRLYPNLTLSGSVGSGYSGANDIQVGEGLNIGAPEIGTVVVDGQALPVIANRDQIILTPDDFETKPLGDQLNDNFNQNLQLGLTIPIFNGNSARAEVNRAKINQLDADYNFSQISNQLRFEIEQAYADAKAAMNSYISADKAVKALEESFKYAEVRFEQKVINSVDYNDIKTRYTNAQSEKLRAKYDFVFRTKILDFYLGNPIEL
jgi:outer membrane protein